MILVILAVVTLGSVSRILDTIQNTGCLSNLKQLSQGCFAYAAEHNNNLPFRYVQGGGWSGYGDPLWYVAVAPYVGARVRTTNYGELVQAGPFKCPADRIPWVGGNPGQFEPSCSYAFPLRLAYYRADGSLNDSGAFVNFAARFPEPSKTVMLIDSAFGNVFNSGNFAYAGAATCDPQETGPELVKRHSGHLNAVFADGHTEPISGDTPSFDPNRPLLWGK